ncbi:MAG TPA: flavin reductase family protein [Clostridia bacterium]|nr:flavin reductase family protein [Clostridia bacterium]
MEKVKLGKRNLVYPLPVVLVGTNTNGKPNYLTVSFCSVVSKNPAMLAISLSKEQYSRIGIHESGQFSVNIPSSDMVELIDYCGLVSGRDTDKSLKFKNFYGLLNVPMIEDCPVNIECKLVKNIELEGSNEIFIGEIIETYSHNDYITNNTPDITKIKPLVISMYDFFYWSIGEKIGKAWSLGKNLINKS